MYSARSRLKRAEYNAVTVIIVLSVQSANGRRDFGAVVDGVSDVVDVNKAAIRPAPELGNATATEYILGLVPVADRMVVLLDIDCLIGNDLRSVSSTSSGAVLDNAAA